jgi:hypothetical protein
MMSLDDRDDPVIWLPLLERGRRTGDFELAARAQQELARLGIRVRYDQKNQKESNRARPARRPG